MAAMLNWNAERVLIEDAEFARAQVIVRNNVATVTVRGTTEVLAQRDQVVGVMPVTGNQRARTITFADGATWTVYKAKGCGCR